MKFPLNAAFTVSPKLQYVVTFVSRISLLIFFHDPVSIWEHIIQSPCVFMFPKNFKLFIINVIPLHSEKIHEMIYGHVCGLSKCSCTNEKMCIQHGMTCSVDMKPICSTL